MRFNVNNFISYLDNTSDISRSALVPAHASHDSSGLDVSAAGVVGHALADQHQGLFNGAGGGVGQPERKETGIKKKYRCVLPIFKLINN